MTVSSQRNKVIYVGNGVATEFAIPFSFLEQEHIKVRQKKNDIQTERTDWEIKGGNIVFKTAPESGTEIAIVREVPLTQETDYRDNEILHAETLERNFDKLTMQVQQLAEKSERAVTVDIFDDTAAASLIPSIRKAVSDCQTAVKTAAANAQTASECADAAATSATNSAVSETNTAAMLETKADKSIYASATTRGLAQWAALSEEISETKPPVIVSVIKNGNTMIRSWSDGLKEVYDFFTVGSNGVLSYTFPTVFNATPFIMLSQTHESGGAVTSVVSSSSTEIKFTVRSGNSSFAFLGWVYLCGY